MVKIMYLQTVLMEDDIVALKKKTKESHTKNAIAKAAQHYLECVHIDDSLPEEPQEVLKRSKILYAQAVLTEDDNKALKIKTRETETKEMLSKVVHHYLNCKYADIRSKDEWAKKIDQIAKKRQKQGK